MEHNVNKTKTYTWTYLELKMCTQTFFKHDQSVYSKQSNLMLRSKTDNGVVKKRRTKQV